MTIFEMKGVTTSVGVYLPFLMDIMNTIWSHIGSQLVGKMS